MGRNGCVTGFLKEAIGKVFEIFILFYPVGFSVTLNGPGGGIGSMSKLYRDKRTLHMLLRKQALTLSEVSEKLGCSGSTLRRRAQELKVVPLKQDTVWLQKKISQGWSLGQIAKRLNMQHSYMPNFLEQSNISFLREREKHPYKSLTEEWVNKRLKVASKRAISEYYNFSYIGFSAWCICRGYTAPRVDHSWKRRFSSASSYDIKKIIPGRWSRLDFNGGFGGLRFPGVYALIGDGELLYIGSSLDIQSRLTEHFTNNGHSPAFAALRKCKTIQLAVQKEKRFCERYMVEARLLQKLRPSKNKRFLPAGA